MDDYLTKRARRYLASWRHYYGLQYDLAEKDKIIEAIRRALDNAKKEGMRAEKHHAERKHMP